MNDTDTIRVWDPLVRIFHWTLAVAFVVAYVSEGEPAWLHTSVGYLIFGLVVLRLVWGVIGSRHARFEDFVRGPGAVMDYLRRLVRGEAPRYLGHNPAGGVMILALLAMLLLTTMAGTALYGVEEGAGPLAGLMAGAGEAWEEALEEVHEVLANLTLALVVLHILGVIVSSRLHGENLARAMVTGRKRREPE